MEIHLVEGHIAEGVVEQLGCLDGIAGHILQGLVVVEGIGTHIFQVLGHGHVVQVLAIGQGIVGNIYCAGQQHDIGFRALARSGQQRQPVERLEAGIDHAVVHGIHVVARKVEGGDAVVGQCAQPYALDGGGQADALDCIALEESLGPDGLDRGRHRKHIGRVELRALVEHRFVLGVEHAVLGHKVGVALGNCEALEVGATQKHLVANPLERGGKGDGGKSLAAHEGAVAYGLERLGQLQGREHRAVVEGLGRDGVGALHVGIAQAGAVAKGKLIDDLAGRGHHNAREGDAAREGAVAQPFQARGQRHLAQPVAEGERVGTQRVDAGRQLDLLQLRALGESQVSHGLELAASGKVNALQRVGHVEGRLAYDLDRGRHMHLGNAGIEECALAYFLHAVGDGVFAREACTVGEHTVLDSLCIQAEGHNE